MRTIAIILGYIIFAILVNIVSYLTMSTFLDSFFDNNIINIIITVFAINMATSSIIVARLGDISIQKGINFKPVYTEIKFSFLVQIFLVVLAFVILIIKKSTSLDLCHTALWSPVFNTLLTIILCAILHILWDTGCAIFEVVENNK